MRTERMRYRWCRHHEKPKPMEHACRAGVDMEAFGHRGALGGFYMLPCHDGTSDGIKKCECPQRSFFTDAEVAQQDAESEAAVADTIRRLNLLAPLMRRIRSGRVLQGKETCPACGSGSLSWRKASTNGHVWARCSTDDCIAFVE